MRLGLVARYLHLHHEVRRVPGCREHATAVESLVQRAEVVRALNDVLLLHRDLAEDGRCQPCNVGSLRMGCDLFWNECDGIAYQQADRHLVIEHLGLRLVDDHRVTVEARRLHLQPVGVHPCKIPGWCQRAALQERLRTNTLETADAERLIGVLNAVTWLYARLEKAKLSLNNLRKVFGFKTEKKSLRKMKWKQPLPLD